MDPIWSAVCVVASFLGGAAAVRWSIKTSIEHGLARSLEEKKHGFVKEIEQERQRFTRDLERSHESFTRYVEGERQFAATALERFKSELSLDAEVRRQAASRKVTALLKVADLTHDLFGRAFNNPDIGERMAAWNEYMGACREAEAILPPEVATHLWAFGLFLQENLGGMDRAREHGGAAIWSFQREAEEQRKKLLAAVHHELGVKP